MKLHTLLSAAALAACLSATCARADVVNTFDLGPAGWGVNGNGRGDFGTLTAVQTNADTITFTETLAPGVTLYSASANFNRALLFQMDKSVTVSDLTDDFSSAVSKSSRDWTVNIYTPHGADLNTFTFSLNSDSGLSLSDIVMGNGYFDTTTTGGDIEITKLNTVDESPVPEPGTMALMGVGLLGLGTIFATQKQKG